MLNVTVFKHGHLSQMHMHSGEIDEAVVNMNVWNDGDFSTYASSYVHNYTENVMRNFCVYTYYL